MRFSIQIYPSYPNKCPATTSCKFEISQYLYQQRAFQNGRSSYVERPNKTQRRYDKSTLKRCLTCYTSTHVAKEIPAISIRKENFQVQLSPFWPFASSLGLYQDSETMAAPLRELGVHLIVYIDDILLLGESLQQLKVYTAGLTYHIKFLGFVMNPKKYILDPTQELEFIWTQVNTIKIGLKLPGGKMKKICLEREIVGGGTYTPGSTVLDLSFSPAISHSLVRPLQSRLQIRRFLGSGKYRGTMLVEQSSPAKGD